METGLAFNDVYLEPPVSDEGSDTMMDLLADDEDVEALDDWHEPAKEA